jgi:hypothetical protein
MGCPDETEKETPIGSNLLVGHYHGYFFHRPNNRGQLVDAHARHLLALHVERDRDDRW